MGLFKAIEELCEVDGQLGEIVTNVAEGIFECCHSIADALEGFGEKLGEVKAELDGKDGEESCWDVDRLDPQWESSPRMKAMRNAVDSIVNFCDETADKLNQAALGFHDKNDG